MLRAFFRDSAVYGTAKLLTGGVALLSLPIYTRALGPADYGVVDLLTTVAAIVHVTVALEISQGYGRYVMSIEGQGERSRYASTALWFTVAAYSAFVLAALPLAGVVSVWWFGSRDHATTEHPVELVHPGRHGPCGLDVDLTDRPGGAADRTCPRRTDRGRRGVGHRPPGLALAAPADPLGRQPAALGAAEGGALPGR